MLKQKPLEMLGGKKTGPLTRQKGQATEMRACWELQARGKGKTHRSCGAVITKILLVMRKNYRCRERTNQKWKLHRSHMQTKRQGNRSCWAWRRETDTPLCSLLLRICDIKEGRLAHNTHIN